MIMMIMMIIRIIFIFIIIFDDNAMLSRKEIIRIDIIIKNIIYNASPRLKFYPT